eukprot:scaffold191_cov677-Pavlova_lutheri.AAC.23
MDKEDNWSLVSAEIRNQKRRRSEGTRESCRTAADRIHHRRRSCKKSSIGSVKPWHWISLVRRVSASVRCGYPHERRNDHGLVRELLEHRRRRVWRPHRSARGRLGTVLFPILGKCLVGCKDHPSRVLLFWNERRDPWLTSYRSGRTVAAHMDIDVHCNSLLNVPHRGVGPSSVRMDALLVAP